jgi:predicted permease
MTAKFRQNVRYGFRMLRKSPGFTIVTVITLALGIGANTAIFSVIYPALLRPLPYQQPQKLVVLGENRQTECCHFEASYPDFLDWRRSAKSFESLAGASFDGFTMTGSGDPKNIAAAMVTPNFFATLGVEPMLGRDFRDGEDVRSPAGPTVAILSYSFWQSDFSGDRNVVGRSVRLDSNLVTIVGVLPKDFIFAPAGSPQLWVPLHLNEYLTTARNARWFNPIGRLAPGVTFDQARAEMEGITAQLAHEYPKPNSAIHLNMGSLRERIVGDVRPLLLVLFGAVGMVLLIACANVASLLMTRSIGRRKEFAVRTALGASRGDLLSQLLTESLMLSFLGAVVGLAAGRWGIGLLLAAVPEAQFQSMPYLREAGINLPVLAFLCGVTLITGILFGLVPALGVLQSPVNQVLKDETRGGTGAGHARLRNVFVIGEIAISLVLLVAAGLMLQSLRALLRQDPGFDPHNLLTFAVSLPYPYEQAWPYDSPGARSFERRFTERLRNLPGVQGVSATSGLPLNGSLGTNRFIIDGRPTPPGQDDEAVRRRTVAQYFEVMKTPLLKGRWFIPSDTRDSPKVWVVNRAFAQRYFPGEEPIGKRLRLTYSPHETFCEIVGVVGDVAEDNLAVAPPPVIYSLNAQEFSALGYLSYVVRTSGDPVAFVGQIRAALHEADPQLALIGPQSIEQLANQSPAVFLRRYPSYLIGSFAALALLLAMVGLYGLISYTVMQRTREIGIRMALGAQRNDILQIVVRQGIVAALAGVSIGIVVGLGLTRLMASLLYGVNPRDGLTFASVSILLMLVAMIASAVPARRATKVDPLIALRYE